MTTYDEMLKWYAEGNLPWDDPLPPPEILDTVQQLSRGRALDVGCGYGRSAIFLAQQGWEVDAVDFVEAAVVEARRRAAKVELSIGFYVADVTELHFLTPFYDFAVDVGCSHALDLEQLQQYVVGLAGLLNPGATYVQYVRLAQSDDDKGVQEEVLRSVLGQYFDLTRIEYGKFARDESEWASAWVWWQRQA